MPTPFTVDVLTVEELAPAVAAHCGALHSFASTAAPHEPGVYVWSADRAVLYIGSAALLDRRLGEYARWIANHDPQSEWTVSVVHMLTVHHAGVQWLDTRSYGDALQLERRLIEWHRACVGCAPIVVGWDTKPISPRHTAETWARDIWTRTRAPHA